MSCLCMCFSPCCDSRDGFQLVRRGSNSCVDYDYETEITGVEVTYVDQTDLGKYKTGWLVKIWVVVDVSTDIWNDVRCLKKWRESWLQVRETSDTQKIQSSDWPKWRSLWRNVNFRSVDTLIYGGLYLMLLKIVTWKRAAIVWMTWL